MKKKNGITARLGKQQLKLSIHRTSVFLRICQRKTRITRGCKKKKGVPIQIRFFDDRQLSVQEWKGGPPTLFRLPWKWPGVCVYNGVYSVWALYLFFFSSGRRRRRTVWIYAAYHLVSRRFAVFDPFYIFPPYFYSLANFTGLYRRSCCVYSRFIWRTCGLEQLFPSLMDENKHWRGLNSSRKLFERDPLNYWEKTILNFFYNSHWERKRRNVQLKFDGGLQLENGVTEIITTRRGVNFCRWECHQKFIIGER